MALSAKAHCNASNSAIVLGDIIVLVSDPFGDPDSAVGGSVNHDSNTRWAWIPERATVDVSHEVRHCGVFWYQPCLSYGPASRCLPDSWALLRSP